MLSVNGVTEVAERVTAALRDRNSMPDPAPPQRARRPRTSCFDRQVGPRLRLVAKRYHDGVPRPREQRELTMPANLTLKGVPDEVSERLKEAATVNHRSLNSEIIAILESQVVPRRASAQEHLAAIRAARSRLKRADFDHADLDRIKREGRA